MNGNDASASGAGNTVLIMTFGKGGPVLEGELHHTESGDEIHWNNGATWVRSRELEPCL